MTSDCDKRIYYDSDKTDKWQATATVILISEYIMIVMTVMSDKWLWLWWLMSDNFEVIVIVTDSW